MKTHEIVGYAKALWMFVDVTGWQKWFGAAVLGFAFALDSNSNFSPLQFQGLAIGIPLIFCYIQSANDYFDVEIDEMKEKIMGKELVVSKIISRKTALIITSSVLFIGLGFAGMASASLFVLAVAMALLGTLYSAPPFRLKMRYPFSTLTQFAGCFLPFLAGVASISTVTMQTIIISSVFAVLAMIHRFAHEIKNYNADLLTGKGTVAVIKGLRTAKTFCKLSALVGVIEFSVFSFFGWLNIVSLFLFVLYVIIIIVPGVCDYDYMPRFLKIIFVPVIMVPSYVLLFTVLLLHGKIYPLT